MLRETTSRTSASETDGSNTSDGAAGAIYLDGVEYPFVVAEDDRRLRRGADIELRGGGAAGPLGLESEARADPGMGSGVGRDAVCRVAIVLVSVRGFVPLLEFSFNNVAGSSCRQ